MTGSRARGEMNGMRTAWDIYYHNLWYVLVYHVSTINVRKCAQNTTRG